MIMTEISDKMISYKSHDGIRARYFIFNDLFFGKFDKVDGFALLFWCLKLFRKGIVCRFNKENNKLFV